MRLYAVPDIVLKMKGSKLKKALHSRWIYKILAAFLLVVFLAGVIHSIAMNLSIAAAFERHLNRMGEGMQTMMGNLRGANLYSTFRAAMNESMLTSAIASFVIAGLAALFLSQRITKPIQTISNASRKIAQGDYAHRIAAEHVSEDELGQLAYNFNCMAEKLESIESMRLQLIGDISHELRTPLTAIKGSMEGLMDGVLPQNIETYQQIYREADRLQRLVEDLHELSRMDGATLKLNKQNIKIPDLVKRTVDPLENLFAMKGVNLKLAIEKGLPTINVDADRIQQVLHNLLVNALQFTNVDGQVCLKIEKSKNEMVFSVSDDGAGIPAEHLDHIFERFYRADKSRSRANGGGSGIGLTIAKSLVEAHSGWIRAESGGRDQGSTFSFSIPL